MATSTTPAKKTAAKKTTAKKAAPAKTAKAPAQSFLYRLPSNWKYGVDIMGPDDTVISLSPAVTSSSDDTTVDITVVQPDGSQRHSSAPSMPEALKAGAKIAKALDAVAQKEAALRAARDESLSFLGDAPSPQSSDSGEAGDEETGEDSYEERGDDAEAPEPVGLSDVD